MGYEAEETITCPWGLNVFADREDWRHLSDNWNKTVDCLTAQVWCTQENIQRNLACYSTKQIRFFSRRNVWVLAYSWGFHGEKGRRLCLNLWEGSKQTSPPGSDTRVYQNTVAVYGLVGGSWLFAHYYTTSLSKWPRGRWSYDWVVYWSREAFLAAPNGERTPVQELEDGRLEICEIFYLFT